MDTKKNLMKVDSTQPDTGIMRVTIDQSNDGQIHMEATGMNRWRVISRRMAKNTDRRGTSYS